jgi:peroxiredoxin Q/BCP
MGARKQRQTLEAGSRAPAFQLRKLSGGFESLEQILSRGPVLLAFFKSSCPICQYTFPFLERIHLGAKENDLQVFAVSQDDDRATRQFQQEFGLTFPALLDESSAGYPVSNGFGISTVPSLFLVERDGSISQAVSGFSKRDMEAFGQRARIPVFEKDEAVPAWKAG